MEECQKMEDVRNVSKVSKLNKSMKEQAYQRSLHRKYEVLRGGDVWRRRKSEFADIVKESNNDLCGMRCVGWERRSGVKKLVWWFPKREVHLRIGC